MVRGRGLGAAMAMSAVLAACGSSGGPTGGAGPTGTAPFSIAIWGDTPYSPAEAVAVPTLVDQVNASDVAFTIFVGDLQGGGRCENRIFTEAADRFAGFEKPLVYTPGDNEWTDCHSAAQDPIERLAHLRRAMFPTDRSFGRQTLKVQRQPAYPENARWKVGPVVFVTINVTGSNNNHIADLDAEEENTPRGPVERRAAEAEYLARDEADRDWLHQAFQEAVRSDAPGVVVAMQADPGFGVAPADRMAKHVDGFDRLLAAFAAEARAFAKPVVVLHGDSHLFRFDRPLLDPVTREPVPNVARVETFGSPAVGWVKVTLDPSGPTFVAVEPHLVASTGG